MCFAFLLLLLSLLLLFQDIPQSSSTLIFGVSLHPFFSFSFRISYSDASSLFLTLLAFYIHNPSITLSNPPQCISRISPPFSSWPAQSQPCPSIPRRVSGSTSILLLRVPRPAEMALIQAYPLPQRCPGQFHRPPPLLLASQRQLPLYPHPPKVECPTAPPSLSASSSDSTPTSLPIVTTPF